MKLGTRNLPSLLILCWLLLAAGDNAHPAGAGDSLTLRLRSRVETFKGSGVWDEVYVDRKFPARETAIVICDMWDKHWCQGASRRCDELAAKMNPVIQVARARGVQIVHSPSDTMNFYADWPQRRRMTVNAAPALPKPLDLSDPPLPIDDSDGGCDTAEKPWYKAWSCQSARIEIGQADVISDNGTEVYNFFKQRGIKTILYMGVHTNMCVLNRTFAIKQMARWGFECILVRDLTDTMYDPKDHPYVSHEQGTELVVEHIEKYWAPSILSNQLLASAP